MLAAARPGVTLGRLHALSVRLLSEGLAALRALPGLSADAIAARHYREFYAHAVGHYLGLDVHDCALAGAQVPLEPGAVLAIEPALYIPDHPRYGALAGIGVRIEDDVEITQSGARVLSDCVPVEADAVEELVGSALDSSSGGLGGGGFGGAFQRWPWAGGGSGGEEEEEGVRARLERIVREADARAEAAAAAAKAAAEAAAAAAAEAEARPQGRPKPADALA